jgi:hypothetical protein
MPQLLWQPTLYARLFDRLLFKDCGPVTAALFAVAAIAAVRGDRPRAFDGWVVMALVFYFALGPLLRYHDYYELMLLPPAAVWAASGWQLVAARGPAWAATAVLIAAAVLHGPWLMGGSRVAIDAGHVLLAERLNELCPPGGRVAVFGPDAVAGTVHYARRDGWAFHEPPEEGPAALDRLCEQGAAYAAVYLSPWVKPEHRSALLALAGSRNVAEHRSRSGSWEYFILDLRTELASDTSTDSGR